MEGRGPLFASLFLAALALALATAVPEQELLEDCDDFNLKEDEYPLSLGLPPLVPRIPG